GDVRRAMRGRHHHAPNHLLQVAMGDIGVVVALGEDFSLLGKAKAPMKRVGRKREDSPGSGSTAATERASAAVEEGEFDVALGGRFVEFHLRAVKCPAGRKVASVLGAVAVADH